MKYTHFIKEEGELWHILPLLVYKPFTVSLWATSKYHKPITLQPTGVFLLDYNCTILGLDFCKSSSQEYQ